MKTMKRIHLLLISAMLMLPAIQLKAQTDTVEHRAEGSKNDQSQLKKPYVILISADGFRHDYAKKYNAEHLLQLSANGVSAESMLPSYPSVTFPNHYSIATGMYPAHHGLVNNSFLEEKTGQRYTMGAKEKVRDGKWYGGTPLWVLAEQQHLLAASMFWVGSEAEIKGTRPSYYYGYTEQISVAKRIEIIKGWLSLPEEKRPHLITFYVSEPDHAGHSFGPDAPQTEKAVKMVDSVIYQLTETLKPLGLPLNYIFVSDHGMTAVDREQPIRTPAAIDTAKYIIASSGTLMDIHAKNKADVAPLYAALKSNEKDFKVYLKSEMPKHLHYSSADDRMNRIGDILLIPEWPKVFSNRKPGIGHHGFDATVVKDMHASFMAWGPAFKAKVKIPTFENVNVYPLITTILGLTYQEAIDGKISVLQPILKK
jgi:predicted AlkP superfamily pyrophosphatase or phosphodiesterase